MAFNPELGNWFPVTKFRFWCQKVLPLVYDDSLSYYEILCKMVDYLNKYGEDLGMLEEDYQRLVEFVNHYFEQDLGPVIQSYVNEWLDDHPEATTTVQDRSITKAKLADSLVAYLPVETFEDMYDTVADEVTVLNDNSYYGSGQKVTFMKSENELTAQPFFRRANGDYMVPKPRRDPPDSNAPVVSIGETISSYVNKTNLVYGSDYGMYNTTCDSEIDCSTFTYAVLQGTPYNKSRYVNPTNAVGNYVGENTPRNISCYYSSNRPYGLKASEQALWFAEQNRLFYIDYEQEHPCTQLMPGDILFECDPNNEVSGSNAQHRYLHIHHCSVVLAVYPENDMVLVAQAGASSIGNVATQVQNIDGSVNVCRLTYLRILSNPTKHVVFARPLYGEESKTANSVVSVATGNTSVTVGGDFPQSVDNFCRVYPFDGLDTNKMYTMIVKGVLPQFSEDKTQLCLIGVSSTTGNKRMAVTVQMDCSDYIAIPFVPNAIMDSAGSVSFGVYIPDSYYLDSEAHTFRIKSFDIVEGLAPNGSTSVIVSTNDFAGDSGATIASSYVFADNKGMHLRVSGKLNEAAATSKNYTIGTVDPELIPNRPAGINKQCTVGTDIRPCSLDPSSGALKVYYKAGEGATSNALIEFDV